ncbi:hypothetical protein ACFX15_031764 [Malus domestica]
MLCVSLSCKGSFPRAHLSPYSPCRAHLWTASFPAPVLPSLVRAFLLLCAVLGQLPVIPPTPAFLFLPCLLSPPHVLPFHLPFDLSPASPFFAAKGSFLPPILQSPPVLSACLCELPKGQLLSPPSCAARQLSFILFFLAALLPFSLGSVAVSHYLFLFSFFSAFQPRESLTFLLFLFHCYAFLPATKHES